MSDTDTIASLDFDFDPIDALTTGPCHQCGKPVENQITNVARARELIAEILALGYGVVPICRECTPKDQG